MKDRITKIIESEKLTASEFADRIGVQRSNVSHVLSGRNQPGFLFIQKILETFTNVNSRWLITGQGKMYESLEKEQPLKTLEKDLFTNHTKEQPVVENIVEEKSNQKNNSLLQGEKPQEKEEIIIDEAPKKIKTSISKVLIFYENDTFKEYNPAE